MNHQKIFRVLVCIDLATEAGRQKLRGVYRFLGGGYVWDISLIRSQKEFGETFLSQVKSAPFDGFLIAMPQNAEMRQIHQSLQTPTVFIDYVDRKFLRNFRDCVFVHDDDRDIARCAAQHLLTQGDRIGYGYAASDDLRPWNRNRAEQFQKALARRQVRLQRLTNADTAPVKRIVEWLRSLPRPAGVLAAYDDTAQRILSACHQAGLKVPEDVAVLGIGNDDLICPQTTPPLSSVIPDFEEEGCRAARELQALMLGRHSPTHREFPCGCKGVAVRSSTLREKNSALLVQQAVAYIRENALVGITAADVVRHLRVSRRLADLRFREVTGTSILAFITDLRLKEAIRLLETTDLRFGEIARQCGYDAANLKNLFARHFKCSMRTWRKDMALQKSTPRRQPATAAKPLNLS